MKNMKPLNILVLAVTPFMTEPRGIKQVEELRKHFNVTTAGIGPSPFDDLPHIEFKTLKQLQGNKVWRLRNLTQQLLRLHPQTLKSHPLINEALSKLAGTSWDVIVSNDLLGVPIATRLQSKYGVIADLHEYAPSQGEDRFLWRLLIAPFFDWLLRKEVAPKIAASTSVGQGIIDEYKRVYGFEGRLVVNATPWHDLKPRPTQRPVRLVHSGLPARARKLEVMIDAVLQTSTNVTLDLYLMQNNVAYLQELKERAQGDPRIRFKDPVPYRELVQTLNNYDVGISLIAPTTFNLKWCLPNKFFDFVQARLGVIIGPSPEMQSFVNKYGFGVATDDFTAEALTRTLDNLTTELVDEWKHSAHTHAEELSGEMQSIVWTEVVNNLVSTKLSSSEFPQSHDRSV